MAKKTAVKPAKLQLKPQYIGARIFTSEIGREVEIVDVKEQFPLYVQLGLLFIFKQEESA